MTNDEGKVVDRAKRVDRYGYSTQEEEKLSKAISNLEGVNVNSISFNAEMAKAHHEGRKTQTRRLIDPQPTVEKTLAGEDLLYWDDQQFRASKFYGRSPYKIGEKLWVKEPWFETVCNECMNRDVVYHAKNIGNVEVEDMWKSPESMPQKYSRSTIEITGIKVEKEDRGWVWVYSYRKVGA